MNAKQITGDIRWIMEDNRLDRAMDFKVQTKKSGSSWVTVIYGVPHDKARAALAAYADRPGVVMERRVFDGYLAVTQPAASS